MKLYNKYWVFFIILLPAILSTGIAKELRWAADAEGNAPYIFQDPRNPNKLIGFEVDFSNELARLLDKKPVFVQNQWDGLIPGLDRDDYDVAINGLEITDDREQAVNFSIPYCITNLRISVMRTNDTISMFEDLHGKKVGALKFSLAERILMDAGGIDVRSYEGEVNAYTDMENGRIDAVLVDGPIAIYYVGWHRQFKLVGKPVGEIKYGVAAKKGDTALIKNINEAIEKMTENGKLREILEKWNLWNDDMTRLTGDTIRNRYEPVRYNYFIETMNRNFDFGEIVNRYIKFLPSIAKAALMTVEITIVSMIIAIVFGLFIAIIRVYAPKPFSSIAIGYIEIIRGTPLLIQLFFIFYALPTIGIKLPPFIAAVVGLGLNYAAYEAENYRAGLFAIPRGQIEAALSLGMSKRQSLRYIILPQAIRIVIPPVTNDFISLLKDSSLVSVITLVELTKLYGQLAATYYDYIGTGIIIASAYFILGLPFVKLSKYLERKMSYDHRKII